MPHLIIEYPHELLNQTQRQALVERVHEAAGSTGLFDISHIKTRAVAMAAYRLGDGQGPFIHAQLRIHRGRDASQKEMLSWTVLNAIRELKLAIKLITVEVVELDRDGYAKYVYDQNNK